MPPIAEQKPYEHSIHDDVRPDPFFWLKERENPDVIAYVERENDYYQPVSYTHLTLPTT